MVLRVTSSAVPGRPTDLHKGRTRAHCACRKCGWGLFGHFFSRLEYLFLPVFWRWPIINIKWFHFECLKLKSNPNRKSWYCMDCRKLPLFSLTTEELIWLVGCFGFNVSFEAVFLSISGRLWKRWRKKSEMIDIRKDVTHKGSYTQHLRTTRPHHRRVKMS